MDILKELLGPPSKYDKTLPYTYEARIDVLHGTDYSPIYDYYYADTLCGLVEYLTENNIDPNDAELYEIYQNGESRIMNEHCLDRHGNWLTRPGICESVRSHYIGHANEYECSYRDRDRRGEGAD